VEHWGHRACRNFWQEHDSKLRHRWGLCCAIGFLPSYNINIVPTPQTWSSSSQSKRSTVLSLQQRWSCKPCLPCEVTCLWA
jgi:hypothetical protein